MKFAIRVLTQYGDNPRDVYNVLNRKFTEVEVHEELQPYKHYHCLVSAVGRNEIQVKKMLYSLKKVNNLIRSKNNLHVTQCDNEPAYIAYMNKEHGRQWGYMDSYKLEAEYNCDAHGINPHKIECQFED